METESAVAVEGLSKSFGALKAVQDLTFEVRPGEIYGFLGPNGAGKTTIKMILGLVHPDVGRVRIEGLNLSERPHEIKRRIGFLPQNVAFYSHLTARQTLEFYASLRGWQGDGIDDALERVGLKAFADKKVGTFSGGMVQLLGVAQALLGDPHLVIMDEPTAGLDPNWRRVLKDRVLEIHRTGATVFFSSHILAEVQDLASQVIILSRGRLVAQGTVDRLGANMSLKSHLTVSVEGLAPNAAKVLEGLAGVEVVSADGSDLVVACDHERELAVLLGLHEAKVVVRDFRTEDPTLEEVFLKYTEGSKGAVR